MIRSSLIFFALLSAPAFAEELENVEPSLKSFGAWVDNSGDGYQRVSTISTNGIYCEKPRGLLDLNDIEEVSLGFGCDPDELAYMWVRLSLQCKIYKKYVPVTIKAAEKTKLRYFFHEKDSFLETMEDQEPAKTALLMLSGSEDFSISLDLLHTDRQTADFDASGLSLARESAGGLTCFDSPSKPD